MGQEGIEDVSRDVIELNGNRYDAKTGANLGKSRVIPKHIVDSFTQGKAVDGFVRKPAVKQPAKKISVTSAVASKKPVTKQAVAPQNRIVIKSTATRTRATTNNLPAHRPERSKTLVRRTTRKPEFKMKTAISRPSIPVELAAKPNAVLVRKRSVTSVDDTRHERAMKTSKHTAIKRFSNPPVHIKPEQVPVIAVQPAPLHLIAPQLVTQKPAPAAPARPAHKPSKDIFEAALAQAASHEQPAHKVRRRRSGKRRAANVLAVIGTFLVIGGFIGYLNMPGIEMRVASVQAGFGASLPGYTPLGYSLNGRVERAGNTISVSFRSGSSNYRITQQQSNWDSQTLLDSTLAQNDRYQTVQRNGQTVYIYEGDGISASWVNSGVRYDLTGNAELSKDEIASIAASM